MQTWLIIYSSTLAAMVTVLVFSGIKSEIDFIRMAKVLPPRGTQENTDVQTENSIEEPQEEPVKEPKKSKKKVVK